MRRIRVVNPNSNETVTRNLDAALDALRFEDGPEIVCSTLAEGPFGIETQADVESVVLPLRRLVEADNASDAFVIACYSDPGLHVCREGTERPVFGIAECGVLTALARAGRFGVIAIGQRSIPRHMRYLRQMALLERLAGERPLGMTVAETRLRNRKMTIMTSTIAMPSDFSTSWTASRIGTERSSSGTSFTEGGSCA